MGEKRGQFGARQLAALSVFTAAALVLHVIEGALPQILPVPGVKLGLANTVTVALMVAASRRDAALVLLARILLGGIFSGQATSLIYSIAGGAVSFCVCAVLLPMFSENQTWALSVAGALGHIAGQLGAAALLLGTLSVVAYAPILLLSASISGLFTGLCAQLVIKRLSRWKV